MTDQTIQQDTLDVEVSVSNYDVTDSQQHVIDMYEQNIETFIMKDDNYGSSYERSAMIESMLRYGEIREDELFDIMAEQILVRGFYDKLSRFHQLQIQNNADMVGEDIEDTLLDLGNYAMMLAAMHNKYNE